jgi:hypothetical protein
MGQTINLNGQFTIVNSNLRTVVNLVRSIATTGSNSIANTANITTGSWTQIDQASNGDFRIGYFANLSTTSSVKVAINSAGTGSYSTILFPGDVAVISNSGSVLLWAYASGSESPATLQYVLSEQ